MKINYLFPIMVLVLSTCAHLPEIRTVTEGTAARLDACTAIFPHGRWQLVHAIEIFPPVGAKQTVLGIVQLSSEKRTFHCVLMTIEGLVLFEADYNGATTIQRVLPPLDRRGMAEGIVGDISLLFFAPGQPCAATGLADDGEWLCRYPTVDQGYEDIALKPDGLWEIRRYSSSHYLTRTVKPIARENLHACGLPSHVVLRAHGIGGYELRMSLIEAVPLEDSVKKWKRSISPAPQSDSPT